jgi:hypothetical protein
MENLNLNTKWELLGNEVIKNGYKALRINSTCIPELFIGLDSVNQPCLLLFSEEDEDFVFKGSVKEKISLSLNIPNHTLIIELKDTNYIDLFNDLILSIYNRVYQISDKKTCIQEFVHSYYKWSEFFEEPVKNRLSNEQIKGLIGELHYLREILETANPEAVDSILESWIGPYETSNDFAWNEKNIEIKTKDISSSLIRISSEFQLLVQPLKTLELVVITVKTDYISGISLRDIITICSQLIRERLGNISIFLKALRQIGLSPESSMEYDNLKFRIVQLNSYDCSSEIFPRLTTQNIQTGISNLKYSLNTNALTDFLIKETKY